MGIQLKGGGSKTAHRPPEAPHLCTVGEGVGGQTSPQAGDHEQGCHPRASGPEG